MLEPNLEKALSYAVEEARHKGYQFVNLEQVLYTLIREDQDTQEILKACGAQFESLEVELFDHLNENCSRATKTEMADS